MNFQMDSGTKGLFILLMLFTVKLPQAYGIIGYDCGSPSANITTLSLLTVDDCDIPVKQISNEETHVQLIQIKDFHSIHVIQCKVEIDRTVKRCGMFSHTGDVTNGRFAYIQEVTREACQHMHTYGTYQIGKTYIAGIKRNDTTPRPITIAGSVATDSECAGETYSDPYGTWDKVVVLGHAKITLQDYTATVKINSNRILLRSGTTCELGATQCLDFQGGHTFWDPLSITTDIAYDYCRFHNYGLIYEGYAHKIQDVVDGRNQTVYTLKTDEAIFALTIIETYEICAHKLARTEHPKLLILEAPKGTTIFQRQPRDKNIDIFAYMNSKFVYVERHIRTEIAKLYNDVLSKQCDLERRMMKNALAIATQAPDVFAYHLMKGPGYMALLAGEVIHIIKCVPVEVKLDQTEHCYSQLPVLHNNETYFLTPQTHILLRQGTQTTCNALAPAMYLMEDSWYKLTPKPVDTVPPLIMKPLTKPTWKYVNPGSLATSGIYSATDLENLKDHIMFPAERPALLNTIAKGIMGRTVSLQGGSISNLMDKMAIEKIVASTWNRFWSKFLIFGNVSAGLLGIYLLIRAIKLILDTLVHGYALHTVYGWSLYLLGAVWDSLTQLLLHLGKKGPPYKSKPSALTPDPEKEIKLEPARAPNVSQQSPACPLLPAMETTTYTLELKE